LSRLIICINVLVALLGDVANGPINNARKTILKKVQADVAALGVEYGAKKVVVTHTYC
jgi:hypothetical protein